MIGLMLDHFRILEQLGAGGMGVVYRARVASGLIHPNICTIYAVAAADGQAYIAMEYVGGRTLSALLGGGGLPAAQAVRYGLQLADALAHAREHGVVHRDLKRANVMVMP